MTTTDFSDVPEHMRALGLGALAHANWHANYFSHENSMWSELSVLQAAHAAEILIKARIAEEHHLLIFESLPKPQISGTRLRLEDLVENGRTYQWKDLPDRLWATAGIELPNRIKFLEFGKLRNSIQHFTAPGNDVGIDAARFIFDVIDPFINKCWGLFAIDYNEDHEPYIYLVDVLVNHKIEFLVSSTCARHLSSHKINWPSNQAYRVTMERRIEEALQNI